MQIYLFFHEDISEQIVLVTTKLGSVCSLVSLEYTKPVSYLAPLSCGANPTIDLPLKSTGTSCMGEL